MQRAMHSIGWIDSALASSAKLPYTADSALYHVEFIAISKLQLTNACIYALKNQGGQDEDHSYA